MLHYVYEVKNNLNGMIYVGVKTNSKHFDDGYFGSGTIIQSVIKKHGYGPLSKRVIDNFGTPEEAFAREAEIVTQEFLDRPDTYNLALGGKGGYLGDEVNEKRRQSLIGHYVSSETKKKISEKALGRPSPRKDCTLTEESKARISKTRLEKGIGKGANNPNSKTFKVIDPEGNEHIITGSLRKFCEERNLTYTTMSMIANGRVFSRGKHKDWKVEIQ